MSVKQPIGSVPPFYSDCTQYTNNTKKTQNKNQKLTQPDNGNTYTN
ncbi:hypothetical protein PPEP_b1118 [Pseudoalteromonas peptidolytica F12-50-A1]|uniref:Uncharacterized protein n=1 Tax=Pseudoalteromonas peptidolytica F12-50-A1 TaxID=1315280 RepID=A0A8I0N1S2_9GAMM|nr:hypothetical protein [Pseudoalteromonas peptidolytica F12-50-A1]